MNIKTTGSALKWRRGQFRMLQTQASYDIAMPEQDFGRLVGEPSGLPDHIIGGYECIPEGLALIAVCACGGRHETAIDIRQPQQVHGPAKALADGVEEAEIALRGLWIPAHLDCHRSPKQHHTPKLVQQFVDALEHFARKFVADDYGIPGMICILDVRERVFCLPLSGPDVNIRHFMVREEVRAQKLDLLAVASIGAWWPAEDLTTPPASFSDVGVSIGYATATFARCGRASITYKGAHGHFAGGSVGTFSWENVTNGWWSIDALLA